MAQSSISKPISFGSSNNISMLFYVYMRLTHHWLLGYSQHKKIVVHICKHAPKWYLLPVWSHFYMCGYGMCTSHGNRIRNDICFYYTSLCLFFFSRNIGYFLQYKKSNFPLGGKIVASPILWGPRQTWQPEGAKLSSNTLKKGKEPPALSSPLCCLPTSASLSLAQVQVRVQVLNTKQRGGDYLVGYKVKVRTIDSNHSNRRKQFSTVSSEIIIWQFNSLQNLEPLSPCLSLLLIHRI